MYQKSIRAACMALAISVLATISCFAAEAPANPKYEAKDGTNIIGTHDGNALTIEAEDLDIFFTEEDSVNDPDNLHRGKTTYATDAIIGESETPNCIRMDTGYKASADSNSSNNNPPAGHPGYIEFSFTAGVAGDYTVEMYLRPMAVSSGKTIWAGPNHDEYVQVAVGKDNEKYNAVQILSFKEAKAGDTLTTCIVGKNTSFFIDKFVVTCVASEAATTTAPAETTTAKPAETTTAKPAETTTAKPAATTTAKPAATTKPATTTPSAPATAEPMTIALAALALSAAGIVVAKKRK